MWGRPHLWRAPTFAPPKGSTFRCTTRPSSLRSRTFDWESVAFYMTISDATSVSIAINVTGGARTRLECNASSVHKQLWVDRSTNGVPQVIAQGLTTGTLGVVCANSVEPMYSGGT